MDAIREDTLRLRRPADGDPTQYELTGIGTLRAGGMFGGRDATLRIDGVSLECRAPKRRWARETIVEDRFGTLEGRFVRRVVGSAGRIEWRGDEYELRKSGVWAAKYHLVRDGIELAQLKATAQPTEPVEVEVTSDAVPAGPLLFAVYLVRRFDRESTSSNWWTGSTGGGGCGGGCGGG